MPLESFDRIHVPFQGHSMWPLLKSGQRLLVRVPREPITLSEADVGNIFVFKDASQWVCHRYLGIIDGEHVFKGDFSTVYESWSNPHILGQVLGWSLNEQRFYFREGRWRLWFVRFQKASILHNGKARRRSRYVALVLALATKPLFYSKHEPARIVDKGLK